MKIPALKEIPASQIKGGQTLHGWWDVACKIWHVMPEGVVITSKGWVGLEMMLNGDDFWFGSESRLLVEDK